MDMELRNTICDSARSEFEEYCRDIMAEETARAKYEEGEALKHFYERNDEDEDEDEGACENEDSFESFSELRAEDTSWDWQGDLIDERDDRDVEVGGNARSDSEDEDEGNESSGDFYGYSGREPSWESCH